MLTDYIPCYSNATCTLLFLLTFIKFEETRHKEFNFVYFLSFFLLANT